MQKQTKVCGGGTPSIFALFLRDILLSSSFSAPARSLQSFISGAVLIDTGHRQAAMPQQALYMEQVHPVTDRLRSECPTEQVGIALDARDGFQAGQDLRHLGGFEPK